MAASRTKPSPAAMTTVEPQVRLTVVEAETALAAILGEQVPTARAKLRFGPGPTYEPLARVLDRAIVQAEDAGVDPGVLAVVEATAQAAEDIVRVRRKGYGVADWIRTPTSSVRIVLGSAGTRSITSQTHGRESTADLDPGAPPVDHIASADADRESAVREALSEVIDPDLGVNIVDLGFVRTVLFEDEIAVISMTLTSAACPLTAIIEKQIQHCLTGHSDIAGFRVAWQWIPAWRPADITESGRAQLRSIGFSI